MRLLLDTHGLIGYSTGDALLPTAFRDLLEDLETEIIVSLASVWEMSIKQAKSKLGLKSGVSAVVQNAVGLGFRLLPIERAPVLAVQHLLPYHGDPFDRLLIAQAQIEGYTLVSRDVAADRYGTARTW